MKRNYLLFCILLILIINSPLMGKDDSWLKSVKPIITKSELKVYKSLKTEEAKLKFQKYFWKSRDPDPETPVNEYREQYYKRARYAKENLKGINSDRGRVYIYLGKPLEIKKYTGYEKIVSCELWIYKVDDSTMGLPPFINILFYKPMNMGDYKLFYPGIQNAYDLLTPSFNQKVRSKYRAYQLLKMDFPELANSTLSVIPMEGTDLMNFPNSSSGRIISKIFSIPEKKVNKSYLTLFGVKSGIVKVDYSFKNIFGKLFVARNQKAGFNFVSYSLIPDHIGFIKKGEDIHYANIQLTVRLEETTGKSLFEKTENIDLTLDNQKKAEIDKKRISFNGFIPVISGEFVLRLVYNNETTKEFLSKFKKIDTTENTGCIGFKLLENKSGISPYQYDSMKIIINPEMIYAKDDTLVGIVETKIKPDVFIYKINDNKKKIENIENRGNYYIFRTSLSNFEDGEYKIDIIADNKIIKKFDFALIPFKEKDKPVLFEKEDKIFKIFRYLAYLGEEFLNYGKTERAIKVLEKIPYSYYTNQTYQLLGKAYYLKGEYKKTIELLRRKDINRTYGILALLANSYLKINKLKKAAEYFEDLRKYGDTIELNNKLGAIYLSLGYKKKAKIYWNRAKKLSITKERK